MFMIEPAICCFISGEAQRSPEGSGPSALIFRRRSARDSVAIACILVRNASADFGSL